MKVDRRNIYRRIPAALTGKPVSIRLRWAGGCVEGVVMRAVGDVRSVDVAGHEAGVLTAILDNHLHVDVRNRPEILETQSNEDQTVSNEDVESI